MIEAVYSRGIQYFIKVAETKNISKAARSIHVSQSTISVAIKQLEGDLGFKLFIRKKGKGGLQLTSQGVELLKTLIAQRELLENTLSSAPQHAHILKIAAIPYFARKFLMPALQDLKLHDQSNVFHVRGGAAEKAVKHGEVDVAFFSAKARPKRSTRLCIEIRKETVGIVGLKSKFQKLEDIKSLAELDDMPWVIGDRPRDDWFSSLDGKLGCFWVDDHFSARSLVLEGHAIALFQLDYFTEMEISKLAVSKIKIPSEGLKLYCVIASGLEVEKMRKIKLLISKVKKMASI